jgi:hypothetical protein
LPADHADFVPTIGFALVGHTLELLDPHDAVTIAEREKICSSRAMRRKVRDVREVLSAQLFSELEV